MTTTIAKHAGDGLGGGRGGVDVDLPKVLGNKGIISREQGISLL